MKGGGSIHWLIFCTKSDRIPMRDPTSKSLHTLVREEKCYRQNGRRVGTGSAKNLGGWLGGSHPLKSV